LTKNLNVDSLPQKLLEAEKAGLIRRTINNVNDEPVVQWKSRVVEESLLSDEQDSESTIFKFLRTIHLLNKILIEVPIKVTECSKSRKRKLIKIYSQCS
jgi:hypothetical protein